MKSPGSCSPPLPCPSCASQRRSTIPVSVHSTAHSSVGLDRHRTAGGRNTPHRTTDDRSCVTQVIPDRVILPSRYGGYSMPFVPGSTNPCRQALNKDKALGCCATAGGSRATRASALHLGRVVRFDFFYRSRMAAAGGSRQRGRGGYHSRNHCPPSGTRPVEPALRFHPTRWCHPNVSGRAERRAVPP